MTQTTSNLKVPQESNGHSVLRILHGLMAGQRGMAMCVAVALLALCWTAPVLGDDGPGIGFRVGAQTLDSPTSLEETTRTRYELEVSSQLFLDGHLDFAFIFGGSSLGTFRDEYVDIIDDVLIEEYYKDKLSLLDIRLAARLYPLGQSRPIRPYVGAGIGYFWFRDSWEDEYYETIEDPFFPGSFITFADGAEDTETVADDFFPFLLAGMTVPIGENLELLFEFEYDFEKEDEGFDFGGPIYMFGARFRF